MPPFCQRVLNMKKIAFYMPKHRPGADVFGAATLGFAGKVNCKDDFAIEYREAPRGVVLNGDYETILSSTPPKNYVAAIALCGNAGGENAFVRALFEKVKCPVVGGGAAMDGDIGGLIAGGGKASVLLIDDERFDVRVETKNIHGHELFHCLVDFDESNPRIITAIDGKEPREWLNAQKSALGIPENDFEHFTLSDINGVNAHLSWNGKNIVSGRDLERDMIARYVKPEEVYASVYDFYNDDENTIVFGCAGIKGITGEISEIRSLGLYMYGEICTTVNGAEFGNLMLSKLTMIEKQ